MLNAFIDLLALCINGITQPLLLYIVHSIKYIFMYSSLCLMLVYASIAVNQRIHGRNILKLFIIPIVFITSLLLVNYNTGLVFTVTAGGRFEYGPYFALFYLLDTYYISVVSCLLIKGRKALSRNHKIILPAVIFILFFGTIFDYLFPQAASLQFTLTMFITMVFCCMQSPNEYYSDDSLMMNKEAFITMCGSRFSPLSHTHCIAINIHNVNLFTNTLEKSRVLHAEGIF